VTFSPSAELPATNPGTSFYVEYVEEENAGQYWHSLNECKMQQRVTVAAVWREFCPDKSPYGITESEIARL
jgi:hypothetical protein